ncbi:hypothetical protein EYF80_028787 [Liparis tanakae]|uniref:Uncharacterized protein n=1 Tax=Liparis tanakae TaxID=230148 RepID=A0A4Z2H5F3_9TELE|nr:hypothetical protein EYF80_028787 [Liparis tanakae]
MLMVFHLRPQHTDDDGPQLLVLPSEPSHVIETGLELPATCMSFLVPNTLSSWELKSLEMASTRRSALCIGYLVFLIFFNSLAANCNGNDTFESGSLDQDGVNLEIGQKFLHLLHGALLLQGGFQTGRGLAAIFQEQRYQFPHVILQHRGISDRLNGRHLHGAGAVLRPTTVGHCSKRATTPGRAARENKEASLA